MKLFIFPVCLMFPLQWEIAPYQGCPNREPCSFASPLSHSPRPVWYQQLPLFLCQRFQNPPFFFSFSWLRSLSRPWFWLPENLELSLHSPFEYIRLQVTSVTGMNFFFPCLGPGLEHSLCLGSMTLCLVLGVGSCVHFAGQTIALRNLLIIFHSFLPHFFLLLSAFILCRICSHVISVGFFSFIRDIFFFCETSSSGFGTVWRGSCVGSSGHEPCQLVIPPWVPCSSGCIQ